MAAPVQDVVRNVHHEQLPLCETRPAYRQGRKLTSVKVFTISDESKHLLIVGVPAIGLHDQVKKLCSHYGEVLSVVFVPNYSEDEFADVFHVHYSKLQSSRFAKRQLDGKEFYGGILHVCYLPEMETVAETRQKLIQRRREVAFRCSKALGDEPSKEQHFRQYKRKTRGEGYEKKVLDPALVRCIWKGEPQREDPRSGFTLSNTTKVYGPELPSAEWRAAGVLQTYLIPNPHKSTIVNRKRQHGGAEGGSSSPLQGPSEATSSTQKPAVLRFIPRQIKGIKRTTVTVKSKGPPEELLGAGDKSLDSTIQAIRSRIRDVSVPNIKIHLSGLRESGNESKNNLL